MNNLLYCRKELVFGERSSVREGGFCLIRTGDFREKRRRWIIRIPGEGDGTERW